MRVRLRRGFVFLLTSVYSLQCEMRQFCLCLCLWTEKPTMWSKLQKRLFDRNLIFCCQNLFLVWQFSRKLISCVCHRRTFLEFCVTVNFQNIAGIWSVVFVAKNSTSMTLRILSRCFVSPDQGGPLAKCAQKFNLSPSPWTPKSLKNLLLLWLMWEGIKDFLKRKSDVLQTPEKERAPHQVVDLRLTPEPQQRDEEGAMSFSLLLPCLWSLIWEYGSMWNDPSGQTLRVHAHLGGHFTWIREIYSTPYPWEGCISHESKQ